MGIYAELGRALASAPRVLLIVADPNGGEDITGEVVFASETHVVFQAQDGLRFTLAAAHLRVRAAVRVAETGERSA